MWGQWCGRISGYNNGTLVINIDKDSPYKGVILFSDEKGKNASFFADITFVVSDDNTIAKISNFNPIIETNNYDEINKLRSLLPSTAKIVKHNTATNDTNYMLIGDNNIEDKVELYYLEEYEAREDSIKMTWEEFQCWSLNEKKSNSGLIFRGQPDSSFPLKTSYHRQNRRDLLRYTNCDLPELSRHLTAILDRHFNLLNSFEYSELLYLAQHHGFPTPLLDWTESPFVASYFAFHQLDKNTDYGDQYVRIFVFDKELWKKNGHGNATKIYEPLPSFCPQVMMSRQNPRALPQQSIVVFSNVYNIERFIQSKESQDKVEYLRIIDIRKSDRPDVMKDLEIMGITASSLFPSLDGVCQALKEIRF